ncbi:hypothetical protein NA56DRAFT_702437 [Hyaloscypha hepaticicola]|uniref:Uncharacterized protein n=1 Tax=Hyaloscypha hepaticicola TaxID=2082293 RepID=A0A2J6Q8P5_9HELO|nr:hypothetical protein NA56DRAFT_702437 [Hyaloscypha hepaticicola]
MLPPIEDSILQSNPKFAALHATLANNILNANGSTKHHPAQKERDAVTETLKSARIRAAKSHLIRTALSNLDLSTTPTTISKSKPPTKTPATLPTELLELILLLSSRLTSAPLSPSSQKLLEATPQWLSLPSNLSQIGSLISTHLQTQALALARIQSPTTNPSFLHRSIPKLNSAIQTLQSEIRNKQTNLATRRTELVSKTTTLLGLYHLATTLVILILEQSVHGSVSRHVKARSEMLAASAQSLSLQVREKAVRGEKMVYTEEVKGALREYVRHLRDGRERLRERRKEAERVLWGYGVGRMEEGGGEKEKVMKEIARVYGEMVMELKEVGRDVERLKGR